MIAILYIDPRGPYPALTDGTQGQVYAYDGVSIWSDGHEHQNAAGNYGDARKYDGPHPVIAHPPCRHWGRLRHLAHVTCLGCERSYSAREHDFCPGCGAASSFSWSDKDCAPRAVEQVRKFGGVLEHPAGSKLWEHCSLPVPYRTPRASADKIIAFSGPDNFGGYTIELDQCEWGHVARKRTWLYLVGVPRSALEVPPFPGREPTKSVSGRRGRPTQTKHPNWREQLPRCSDPERRRTPQLFAEYLIRLARAAGEARKVA